ncbi:hypothetical protein E2C01_038903 [Portunus trituberculatus]|uniref:Uncharacterized protein n=1 Tax=Portunus trituberculatus TaxID=210409 RepID=A0A5B7FDC9_PORTR|nr:hypothetical protein [Portunus trituberculatus]
MNMEACRGTEGNVECCLYESNREDIKIRSVYGQWFYYLYFVNVTFLYFLVLHRLVC